MTTVIEEMNHASATNIMAQIVAAYVGNNPVSQTDLPKLMHDVHRAALTLNTTPIEPERKPPAVPISKSVTPDFIVCLEDGAKFKSLRRHLRTAYGMTPEQYREKWRLPADYPLTAPNYSARRSELAKQNGLGKKG